MSNQAGPVLTAGAVPGPPVPGAVVARVVAPGGWRRAVVGFAVGVFAGALAAVALPGDDLVPERLVRGRSS